MGVASRIGRVFKPLVNFPRWMGLNQLWANGRAIVKMVKDMKVHRPITHSESFEEAKARLHLSEEDLEKRKRTCFALSLVYSFAALCFLVYTLHMIIRLQLGMIVGILITILMAVFAYRESFWYFQMKTRTLRNTFKDWLSFILRGARK
jgi:intracellular multiplication protein IcmV